MGYRDRVSLAEARRRVLIGRETSEGVRCSCCDLFCKVYHRNINSGMARALIWIVKQYLGGVEWVNVPRHAPKHVIGNREYGRFVHWDFLVPMPNDKPAKRTSGIWQPTEEGIAFAENKIRVPRKVCLYDNEVLRWDTKTISIVEALGKKWDYREIWNA